MYKYIVEEAQDPAVHLKMFLYHPLVKKNILYKFVSTNKIFCRFHVFELIYRLKNVYIALSLHLSPFPKTNASHSAFNLKSSTQL